MSTLNIEFRDSDQFRDSNKPKFIGLKYTIQENNVQFSMTTEFFNDLIKTLQTIPGIISVTTKEPL